MMKLQEIYERALDSCLEYLYFYKVKYDPCMNKCYAEPFPSLDQFKEYFETTFFRLRNENEKELEHYSTYKIPEFDNKGIKIISAAYERIKREREEFKQKSVSDTLEHVELFRYVTKGIIEPNQDRLDGLNFILKHRICNNFAMRNIIQNHNYKSDRAQAVIKEMRAVRNIGYIVQGLMLYKEYEKIKEEYISNPVSALQLSNGTKNALNAASIRDIDYLKIILKINPKWYDTVRNLGVVKAKELYQELKRKGIIERAEFDALCAEL